LILLIRKIVAGITGKEQPGDFYSGYITKNSVQLFFMHCMALGLGFVSNYVLVKIAGVNNYGSYVYIFNLLYLLAAFCMIGTDTLLVKKISVYDSVSKHPELKGIIFYSWLMVFSGVVLVAIVSKVIFSITGIMDGKTTINWLLLTFLSLVMLSVTTVNQASLQGLKKIFFSQVSEKLIRPLLVILLALAFLYKNNMISVEELIWINIAAIAAAMLVTIILLGRSIPFKLKSIRPEYEIADWTRTSLSFFLLSILYVLNSRIDIFLLGLYRTSEEIGVYNIALRISEVIGFGLTIINFVLAPLIAKLYANGERIKLQQVITRSSRMVLFISLPLAIIIVIFRDTLLSFFGVDFLNGNIALLILCFGQLLNVICGSVGLLLVMTGYEKFSIVSLAAGICLNIVLNLMLIPKYGLTGTAIATSSGFIIWNLLMYLFVRKKLKIHTTALGVI
jgi:O-antigen/teichoic acid export membrane protein